MSNYRPISLLPLVSKCFEKIFAKQLTDYLVQDKYLSDIQHGFRSKRSCDTALLRLTNLLFSVKRRKLYSCLVTIYFSRTFDCINYALLLGVLQSCGINGWALASFSSNLQNRSQCTKYFNTFSDTLPISSDVLLGSVLGPILFNVFIIQLLKRLSSDNAIAYADDLTFVGIGYSPVLVHQQMQPF